MGSALYISIKDCPSELDTMMNGKAIASAWDVLDGVAESLGVPPINKICNNAWKAPEKGIPVFEKYLAYVQENSSDIEDHEAVADDLRDIIRLINEAKRLNTKWRLLLDY